LAEKSNRCSAPGNGSGVAAEYCEIVKFSTATPVFVAKPAKPYLNCVINRRGRSLVSRRPRNSSVNEKAMNKQTETKIRERAYTLWENAGKIHGREMDFWLQAEQEINKAKKPAARKRAALNAKAKAEKAAAPKKPAAKAKPAAKTGSKKVAASKAASKTSLH
jgi:hypothetical protein